MIDLELTDSPLETSCKSGVEEQYDLEADNQRRQFGTQGEHFGRQRRQSGSEAAEENWKMGDRDSENLTDGLLNCATARKELWYLVRF